MAFGDEHKGQHTTELVNPIIKYLLETSPENRVFHSLTHLVFTYLEDYHLHFTGENTEALGGWLHHEPTLHSQGRSLNSNLSICKVLLGSIQSLTAQKPP